MGKGKYSIKARLPKLLRGKAWKMIVDPWGMFKPADFKAPVQYHPIGRSHTS